MWLENLSEYFPALFRKFVFDYYFVNPWPFKSHYNHGKYVNGNVALEEAQRSHQSMPTTFFAFYFFQDANKTPSVE
jgi:hypothetical protein